MTAEIQLELWGLTVTYRTLHHQWGRGLILKQWSSKVIRVIIQLLIDRDSLKDREEQLTWAARWVDLTDPSLKEGNETLND